MSMSEIMSSKNSRALFSKPIEEIGGKWNAEVIEQLKQFIADNLSTTQIAAALSRSTGYTFTRNAIIGKARRLDLPLKFKLSPRPRDQSQAKPRRAKAPPAQNVARKPARKGYNTVSAPQFPSLENIVANPLKRDIYAMQRGECYWPVASDDEKGNILFCGHATGDGNASWCAAHRKIGYAKPWERR